MIERLTPQALARAVNLDYQSLRWLRNRRRRAWGAFLGRDFALGESEELADAPDLWEGSPQNLTAQQVKALLPLLAFTCPSADISSDLESLDVFDADLLRQACDKDAEELELEEKYQEAAMDAILGGLVCHIVTSRTATNLVKFRDREAEPGALVEEAVDLDDVCWDRTAKRFRQRRREAFRRLIDPNEAIEYGFYGRDAGEVPPEELHHPLMATRAEAEEMLRTAQRVRGGDLERVSDLWSGETGWSEDGLDEEVWIWSVIVFCGDGRTYEISMLGDEHGVDEGQERFLLVEPYDGPNRGPLHWLSLLPAGAAVCPQSLDALQRDLAMVADALTNKVVRSTLRAKLNTIYKPHAREEMRAILDADEDEAIAGDPRNFTTVQTGGLINDIVLGSRMVTDWWDSSTNGARIAAGMEDKSKGTATAYAGMMNRVMNWTRFLQRRFEGFATACLRSRLWHRMEDPTYARVLQVRLPNTETIDVIYDQRLRRGRFWDYNIRVRAYSAEVQDPEVRAARIAAAIAPGGPIDAVLQKVLTGVFKPRALRDICRLYGLPELEGWLNDVSQLRKAMAMQAATAAAGGFGEPPRLGASAAPRFVVGGGGGGYGGGQVPAGGVAAPPMGAGPRSPARPPAAGGDGRGFGAAG